MSDSSRREAPAPVGPDDEAASQRRRTLAGIALIVLSAAVLPVMDSIAKHLIGEGITTGQVTWSRYAFSLVIVLPLSFIRYGIKGSMPGRPALQVARGLVVVVQTYLFFACLAFLPLAEAIALFFTSPFMIVFLSKPMLGEKLRSERVIAALVGFAGALIIIRPGMGFFSSGAILALGAAFMFALYIILSRKLAGGGRPVVTLLSLTVVGFVATSAILPFEWVTPDRSQLMWMVAIGLVSGVGQLFLVWGYEYVEAGVGAPLHYLELIFATILGFAVFGELPDMAAWIGGVLILAAGLYGAMKRPKALARQEGMGV